MMYFCLSQTVNKNVVVQQFLASKRNVVTDSNFSLDINPKQLTKGESLSTGNDTDTKFTKQK